MIGEEPLGTVCECCWTIIPDGEKVWYGSDDTPMCDTCHQRTVPPE